MEGITGILLAGGKSSRMGTDKGLLELEGKKFVEHIIDAMKPVVDEIIIIANQDGYNQFGYKVYTDLVTDCGPMGGIYTGLIKSTTKSNLVLSCDMPDVTTATLKSILIQAEEEDALVPLNHGSSEPLCAVYSKSCIEKLKSQIDLGKFKMKDALEEMDVKYILLSDNSGFENINTPVELENRKHKKK